MVPSQTLIFIFKFLFCHYFLYISSFLSLCSSHLLSVIGETSSRASIYGCNSPPASSRSRRSSNSWTSQSSTTLSSPALFRCGTGHHARLRERGRLDPFEASPGRSSTQSPTSARRTRSSSPMKNTLNLTRLETPVYYGLLITGHLDVLEDLENHYNAIDNVGGLGELVVPAAMKASRFLGTDCCISY